MIATLGSIKIKDDEFVELKDIIYKHSAIALADTKKYLVENRLSKRLHELNFKTFKDYIYYLKYGNDKAKELEIMTNLVTINETYFLREKNQMDNMVNIVLPKMIQSGKKNIRIWSAACSTGEEPYSIAILLNEAGMYNKTNIEICATDINTEVVEFAKKGVYRTISFRGAHEHIQKKYFTQKENYYTISDEIKKRVRFNTGNLISPTIGIHMGKFDIIFCRNVLIYFDKETKMKVVDMFYRNLNVPGYLYLGHSESLARLSEEFKVVNFGTGLMHIKE